MGFAGRDYIDSKEMKTRIDELADEMTRLVFRVYRLRNDEKLGEFSTREGAEDFIDVEDYDPDKVRAVMTNQGLSDEDAEELSELQAEYQEGLGSFADWEYGITVQISDNISSSDYAYEYIDTGYGRDDLFRFLEDYIDFSDLGDALLEDVEFGEIGGTGYYNL